MHSFSFISIWIERGEGGEGTVDDVESTFVYIVDDD